MDLVRTGDEIDDLRGFESALRKEVKELRVEQSKANNSTSS